MMDDLKSDGARREAPELWREALASERRQERSRVVPLPLALAAVMLPFLAAWAAADEPAGFSDAGRLEAAASARELPQALQDLGRENRIATPGRYVDVWGRTAPWEADALLRRGYVRPGR